MKMSRLQTNNGETSLTDVLLHKLEPWANNPPDYHEMQRLYKAYGNFKAAIKRKEREITRIEESITAEIDKPRSNEAKQKKLKATVGLKDDLAELEAEFAIIESEVKALEFLKTMFQAATFRVKQMYDI
jgi:hypothetical protein